MKLSILSDADWDAKVDKVHFLLSDFGYRKFFERRSYGNSVEEVAVFLICRDPELNFKQRIKFSKRDKTLYLDIMLDLNQFRVIEQDEKNRIVAQKLVVEIPPIVAKYKFADFDLPGFEADLKGFLKKIKWYE